jgi:hypothetical protein
VGKAAGREPSKRLGSEADAPSFVWMCFRFPESVSLFHLRPLHPFIGGGLGLEFSRLGACRGQKHGRPPTRGWKVSTSRVTWLKVRGC